MIQYAVTLTAASQFFVEMLYRKLWILWLILDERVIGIMLIDEQSRTWLLVNVYLPFQPYDNLDISLENLGKVKSFRCRIDHDLLAVAEDFIAGLNTPLSVILTNIALINR